MVLVRRMWIDNQFIGISSLINFFETDSFFMLYYSFLLSGCLQENSLDDLEDSDFRYLLVFLDTWS